MKRLYLRLAAEVFVVYLCAPLALQADLIAAGVGAVAVYWVVKTVRAIRALRKTSKVVSRG
jgi:hypothetical protein